MTLSDDCLRRLIHLAVIIGERFIFVIRAALPGAVPPQAGLLLLLAHLVVAQLAHPLFLGGADVADHHLLLGARVAHQEAAPAAVVAAHGHGELGKAAQAPLGGAVRDPGDGVVGGWSLGGALHQAGLAALDVGHPGPLLIESGRRHEEGLGRRADQPLVAHDVTVLHVLQLDVLWGDSEDGTSCVIFRIYTPELKFQPTLGF